MRRKRRSNSLEKRKEAPNEMSTHEKSIRATNGRAARRKSESTGVYSCPACISFETSAVFRPMFPGEIFAHRARIMANTRDDVRAITLPKSAAPCQDRVIERRFRGSSQRTLPRRRTRVRDFSEQQISRERLLRDSVFPRAVVIVVTKQVYSPTWSRLFGDAVMRRIR